MEGYIRSFTATILNWQRLLKPDKYKDIIINSLNFMHSASRVWIYGFVIMPNHVHILWRMQEGHNAKDVQRDFLKFISQKIKDDLLINHQQGLAFLLCRSKRQKISILGKKSIFK